MEKKLHVIESHKWILVLLLQQFCFELQRANQGKHEEPYRRNRNKNEVVGPYYTVTVKTLSALSLALCRAMYRDNCHMYVTNVRDNIVCIAGVQ